MNDRTKAYGQLGFFLFAFVFFSLFFLWIYYYADQMFPLKRDFNPDDLREQMFMSGTMGFGICLFFMLAVECAIDMVKEERKKRKKKNER